MKSNTVVLALDIGNTNTGAGLFQKKKLIGESHFRSIADRTIDEIWFLLRGALDQHGVSVREIEGVVISSVVPALTEIYVQLAKTYLHHTAVVIRGGPDLGISINYDNPAHLGADRICSAVAVFERYGGPAIVADFGTATTYDVISKTGEFLGGVIAPGVGTSAFELFRRTAQLPVVPFQFPANVLGKDTTSSLQSGILFGAVESADGMIRRIKRVAGRHAIVVATGGFAGLMAEMSHEIRYTHHSLVLEGARILYDRLRRNREAPPLPATKKR
ncbi:MAG TPA: type III pantothenate kinase [Bacteroidota bacterium]|nr:type III pantothenate kinase [Bacteroidota bacterium]